MTTLKAKEILKDRFWIIQDGEVRIGTLSISEDMYMFSSAKGTRYFDSKEAVSKVFGKNILVTQVNTTNNDDTVPASENRIYGYPTLVAPYNIVYDVKHKLPIFSKSDKSKTLYCAGYYVIKFNKGWVKSFCPKLVTLENNQYQGPFTSELEMKQILSGRK